MSFISVIIPVHSRTLLLAQVVDQFVTQAAGFPCLCEIIVVDDASDPPVRVSDVHSSVQLIRSNKNMGAQAARRLGLQEANGEIVHFHDSDDLICDGWLASVIDAFAGDPELGLLISARCRQAVSGCEYELIKPGIAVSLARSPGRFYHYQQYRNAIGPIGGVTVRAKYVRGEDFIDVPASQDWLFYDAVLRRNPKISVRHDIRYVARQFGQDRISASCRRRVKGYIAAARCRFSSRWAQRAAATLYCANAGAGVRPVVHVRNAALWRFLGHRVARSRLLFRALRSRRFLGEEV